MNKSKLFAFVISSIILGAAGVAYAATTFVPPQLIVSKPVQPPPGIAPAGALHVPFTNVDLTARGMDILVDSITVTRTGPGNDEVFDGIILLDENGDPLTDDEGLDYYHQAEFTDGFIIPAGHTIHVTVAANMADDLADFDGQAPTLTVTAIAASGVVVVR